MKNAVTVSFLETYNAELIMLQSSPNYKTEIQLFDDPAKKGSIKITGLEERTIKKEDEIYSVTEKGP